MHFSLPASGTVSPHAHPLKPLARAWVILLALTLFWDFAGLDMPLMVHIGNAAGFPLRDNWWLSNLLHDRLRLLAQLLFVVMLVWASFPMRSGGLPRRERWLLVGLVLASLLLVNLVKINSRTSCPWDLRAFGGEARYVSHWLFGVGDGGGGRCFPGGHASSALGFFALCLPWLSPPPGVSRHRTTGWSWLVVILAVGAIAGATQTLRGAHHPSHTLWTLVICAGVSMAGWSLGQRWLRPKGQAGSL